MPDATSSRLSFAHSPSLFSLWHGGRLQLDHVTMKLQSVLNGRENDINARKAAIHKKLAKHVNKACNARCNACATVTMIRYART